MKLAGTFTAIVTPFKDGKVNEARLRELVKRQIDNGTDGIVPCGTTGESPTLSDEEKERVIEIVVKEVKGQATVIAGTGTNNTEKTIKATLRAKEIGADAALVITPYYNKPTQEGLFRHFGAVLNSVDIPIVIYNVPGRTSVNMLPATLKRLSEFDNIVAIKEASGNLDQITEMLIACGGRVRVLSGDDSLFGPILSLGGSGVISVVSNVAPAEMKSLFKAHQAKDTAEMTRWHQKLFPLCKALFLETNPIPVKAALNLMGLDVGETRLPLAPMGDANLDLLKKTLKEYGLIS